MFEFSTNDYANTSVIFTAISDKGADRYTKKLFAKPFIQMLTYAVIQNLDGLREIREILVKVWLIHP